MTDKRTQLLEAAIDLFAQEGFWNTPTARIAKHAGVATGTLFNYFESKDALIDAVFLQLKGELGAAMLHRLPQVAEMRPVVEHIWFQYFNWALEHQRRYQLMHQLKLSKLVSADAKEQHMAEFPVLYGDLFAQAEAEGLLAEYPIDFVLSSMEAQLDAAIQYAMNQALTTVQATRLNMQSFNIFWNGITT